jgi:hypothetical protein
MPTRDMDARRHVTRSKQHCCGGIFFIADKKVGRCAPQALSGLQNGVALFVGEQLRCTPTYFFRAK